jgi:predicted MFS family arabinose efflux permease
VNDGQSVTFSQRYVVYAIGLLAAINMVNYMDRMVLSVLLPHIKADLALSDTQLGLLTGFAFALFYAAFGIPLARWADRGNRRNLISLALTVWSIMTAACGLAQGFLHLLLARVGIGVGEAGCIPPSHSLISDYVPPERRSTALSIHTAGATVGIIVGLGLGGWLGTVIGWRLTFLAVGAPGLLIAVVLRLTLREPPRGHADGIQADSSAAPNLKEVLAYLWGQRSYVHLVGAFAFGSFAAFGLSQWMPSFYVRSFGMSTAAVGVLFGLAYGAGEGLGTLIGGPLADMLMKRDRRWGLWLGALSYAGSVPIMLGVFLTQSMKLAVALTFISFVVVGLPNGPLFAAVQSVVAPRMRALASAVTMFSAAVFGIGAGPFVVGVLSDIMNPWAGEQSLRYALVIATVFFLFPIAHFLLGTKTLVRDQEAARARGEGTG